MLHTTKTFENDNTIYFECMYRTAMGVLDDPYNPTWEIKTSRGTVVASNVTSGGPYKRDTGYWYFFWTPTTVGDYVLTWGGEVRGHSVKIRRPFKIIESTTKY
jgi:hypothetical protein